jgi:hypothetical protein
MLKSKILDAEELTMRIVFPTIALWLLTVAACGQQKKTEVFEKDWVMTPRTASSYVVGIVQPLLDKAMRDQSYPPGISQRIARIFTRIQNKEIIYLAEPFYSPLNKKMLAHVDYDVKQEKPIRKL